MKKRFNMMRAITHHRRKTHLMWAEIEDRSGRTRGSITQGLNRTPPRSPSVVMCEDLAEAFGVDLVEFIESGMELK